MVQMAHGHCCVQTIIFWMYSIYYLCIFCLSWKTSTCLNALTPSTHTFLRNWTRNKKSMNQNKLFKKQPFYPRVRWQASRATPPSPSDFPTFLLGGNAGFTLRAISWWTANFWLPTEEMTMRIPGLYIMYLGWRCVYDDWVSLLNAATVHYMYMMLFYNI